MKRVLLAGVMVLIASRALAQVPGTPMGHEVRVTLSHYTYAEPGDLNISIHGAKAGGEYTGTVPLNRRRRWFARADVRGALGHVTYDGWCLPWLITPDSASPNGYALDLGDASPCSEAGDRDWYVEGRALAGKDLVGRRWGVSPYTGLGVRHLSNGTTGTAGYRTETYLYLPVGVTARTSVASRALGVTLEYDRLLRGWQTTRNSKLGGGLVPATTTAPAFTLDGLTDVSFDQHRGWALAASASYQVTRAWSIAPYYVHWRVGASSVSRLTATFTVNGVTAHQQLGAVEPLNTTNELGVKLGFRF